MPRKQTTFSARTRKKKPKFSRHSLRDWRKARDLTQEELAERIGMTHASVQRMETGQQALTQPVLDKLAIALQTTRGNILDRKPTASDYILDRKPTASD